MSTFPLALVHNPAWIETFDSGLDRVAALARSVPHELNRNTAKLRFYFLIRKLNIRLEESLNDLDRVGNEAQQDHEASVIVAADRPDLADIIDSGVRAYRAVEAMYNVGSLAGLRKRGLTAGQMRHLHELLERMGDYVFWLQELADELATGAGAHSFSTGLDEFARGETVPFL